LGEKKRSPPLGLSALAPNPDQAVCGLYEVGSSHILTQRMSPKDGPPAPFSVPVDLKTSPKCPGEEPIVCPPPRPGLCAEGQSPPPLNWSPSIFLLGYCPGAYLHACVESLSPTHILPGLPPPPRLRSPRWAGKKADGWWFFPRSPGLFPPPSADICSPVT